MPDESADKAGKDPVEYEVIGTDMHGEVQISIENAESVQDIVQRLRADGTQVSSLRGKSPRGLFEPRKAGAEEFAFFNTELAAACKRGAALPEALRMLGSDMSTRAARKAIEEVAADVEQGVDLADAMSRRSDVFPAAYVALVKSGLASGNLSSSLLMFAEEAKLSSRLKRTMIGALVYPCVLILLGLTVMAFWTAAVLPAFVTMYKDLELEDQLPALTRLHLAAAPLIEISPVIFIALVLLIIALWKSLLSSSGSRLAMGKMLLALPMFGRYFRSLVNARFSRTLANALGSGASTPDALVLAGLASGNAAVQQAVMAAAESASEGSSISTALESAGQYFSPTLIWMLRIAEKRGDVPDALIEGARLEEDRAERLGARLPVIVGGLTMFFGALLAAELAYSMLLPLIRLMSSIG